MDLKCVQLIHYFDSDISVYNIMSNTLLPLPEIDDYLIKPIKNQNFDIVGKGPIRKNDSITDFAEKVRESLLNSSSLKEKPSKHSRWAGVANSFRYYHFWFKSSYWSNWGMSYRLWRFNEITEEDYANRYCLYLTLNRKVLLADGLTMKQFNSIKDYLINMDIKDFEFEEGDDYIAVLKEYSDTNLTDELRMQITDDLIMLINKTKEDIDKLSV